jgi:hypothetical protein
MGVGRFFMPYAQPGLSRKRRQQGWAVGGMQNSDFPHAPLKQYNESTD